MIKRTLACLLTSLFLTGPCLAAPFSYTYSGNWTNSFSGDFASDYSATVIFDNGNNSTVNQTYTLADFISATIISGAYNITMTAANITSWEVNFTTDVLGQLGAGWFNASGFGSNWHFDTWVQDANFGGSQGSALFFSSNISAPGVSAVPEPATLALASLALVGIGLARRKAS